MPTGDYPHDSLVQPDHRLHVESTTGIAANPNSQAAATADAIADAQRVATEAERERCLDKVRKEMAAWDYAFTGPATVKAVREACRAIMRDIESGP